MKHKYTLGAFASLLLLAALGYFYCRSYAPFGQPPLKSLTAKNIIDVKNEFNAAKGDVRVLLLLSPT